MAHHSRHRFLASLAATSMMIASTHVCADSAVVTAANGIGITPESLVVAGLEEHANTVLARIEIAEGQRQALVLAQQMAQEAADAVSQHGAQLLADTANESLVSAYEQAVEDLDGWKAQIETARQALFAEATLGLPEDGIERLLVWRVAAAFRVPPEFRALEATPSQWREIEKAMRAEGRAERRGEDLEPDHAALLGQVRSDVEVISAAQRLELHLDAVREVFDSYEEPE